MRNSRRTGFTLLELMTVTAIMVLLARTVMAVHGDHLEVGRHVHLVARAQALDMACASFQRARGRWPAAISELSDAGLVLDAFPASRMYRGDHEDSSEIWPPQRETEEPIGPGREALLLLPSAPGRRDVAGARVVDGRTWLAAQPPGGWGW